jgi:magnesium and cobalt transporter
MSEPPAASPPAASPARKERHRTLLERLSALVFREPENREELLEFLSDAHGRELLDADALSMIEGVLQVAELRARDLMIPRSQMDTVDVAEPMEAWLPMVIETGHSRFPVIEGNRDHVIGILLAKDLLRVTAGREPDVRAMLRPAVFIPESKPLNVLLRDFRAKRNHMAIVVDEYGGVAGMITIEDVLEQIVGDIDDEYDFDEQDENIIAEANGGFRVKSLTEIEQFNASFGTRFPEEDFNTIGGLVTDSFGRVPRRGDAIDIDNFHFEVLRADARQAQLFHISRVAPAPAREFADGEADQHA